MEEKALRTRQASVHECITATSKNLNSTNWEMAEIKEPQRMQEQHHVQHWRRANPPPQTPVCSSHGREELRAAWSPRDAHSLPLK